MHYTGTYVPAYQGLFREKVCMCDARLVQGPRNVPMHIRTQLIGPFASMAIVFGHAWICMAQNFVGSYDMMANLSFAIPPYLDAWLWYFWYHTRGQENGMGFGLVLPTMPGGTLARLHCSSTFFFPRQALPLFQILRYFNFSTMYLD